MKQKIGVVAICLLMLVLVILLVSSAIGFMMGDELISVLIGIAVLVVTVIGVGTIARELQFGWQTEKLAKLMAAEDMLPEDDLPRTAGGRIQRDAADAQFEVFKAETEAAPEDWRSWFRLSLGYDASGDRKRARSTMRRSIKMFKASENSAR